MSQAGWKPALHLTGSNPQVAPRIGLELVANSQADLAWIGVGKSLQESVKANNRSNSELVAGVKQVEYIGCESDPSRTNRKFLFQAYIHDVPRWNAVRPSRLAKDRSSTLA